MAEASCHLRDQHLGVAFRAGAEARKARRPRHGPGGGVGCHRLPRLRRRLVHGGLGAEPGGHRDLHAKPRAPGRLPARPARLPPGTTWARRTASAATSWTSTSAERRDWPPLGRRSPRAACTCSSTSSPTTWRRTIPGSAASGLLHPGKRGGCEEGREVLHRGGRHGLRPWPGSLLPGLARRPPAQCLPPRAPAGGDRDALGDCRAVRRRPLRHGDALPQPDLRAHLGNARRSPAGQRLLAHA